MSKKKIIIPVIVLLVIAAGIYAWREYNRTVKGVDDVEAAYSPEAVALIHEFENDEPAANKKYLEKIITVSGLVKNVITVDNTYTIVVGDTTEMSSVRCLVDSNHVAGVANLQRGKTIIVKGALTGFKKDDTGLLGSDVELNRCIIQKQ